MSSSTPAGVWSDAGRPAWPPARRQPRLHPAGQGHPPGRAVRQAALRLRFGARASRATERSIFVVPWAAAEATGPPAPDRYTYLGHHRHRLLRAARRSAVHRRRRDYVLRAVNALDHGGPHARRMSPGTWAGLRPLDKRRPQRPNGGPVPAPPRDHLPERPGDGDGGKLTTYRRMAADAVDAAPLSWPSRRPGRRRPRPIGFAVGQPRPPTGWSDEGRPTAVVRSAVTQAASAWASAQPPWPTWSAGTASESATCWPLPQADPRSAEPLVPGLPYLKAEAVYAARHEMARTLDRRAGPADPGR